MTMSWHITDAECLVNNISIMTEPEVILRMLKCRGKYVPEAKPREHTALDI